MHGCVWGRAQCALERTLRIGCVSVSLTEGGGGCVRALQCSTGYGVQARRDRKAAAGDRQRDGGCSANSRSRRGAGTGAAGAHRHGTAGGRSTARQWRRDYTLRAGEGAGVDWGQVAGGKHQVGVEQRDHWSTSRGGGCRTRASYTKQALSLKGVRWSLRLLEAMCLVVTAGLARMKSGTWGEL